MALTENLSLDLQALVDHMLEGFAYCEAHFENGALVDYTYRTVNSAFERLTGLTNVVGKRVTELLPGIRASAPQLFEIYGRVVTTGEPAKYETYVPQLGRWFAISVFRPAPGHFAATFDNITERKQAEETMRIAAATFEAQEAILVTDAQEKILRVNHAFEEITGYRADEVIGQSPRILSSGWHDLEFYRELWAELLASGRWSGEIMDRRKNGETYIKFMTITAAYDGARRLTHYVAVFRDISAVKKAEHEAQRLAYFDPLTNLPNRRLLLDRLGHAMDTGLRRDSYGALIFLDVDHFKNINDTRGHAMGDLMLVEVARRLRRRLRAEDSVARMGGDEFVILVEELSSEAETAAAQAEVVAEKIREDLAQPYLLKGAEYQASASLGITLFRGREQSVEDILKQADVAMYQAKASGRDGVRFFDPAMQTVIEARAALEADLRHALDRRQFRMHFQVQVDRNRHPLGAEVLLRWNHPERGAVSPALFIPLAEETGLIERIGGWVLAQACIQLAAWQRDPATRHLTLAVNVSARQFHRRDFAAQVAHVLKKSGAPATQLKLELTESIVIRNVEETIATMRELKQLGVKFSLDDFGTGYSSLAYLKRLPLDQIKIDQSFVRDIDTDPNDAAIVQTIIAMTRALALDVIAEGVETESQRGFLEGAGCHAYQGYMFGRPVPLAEFEALLRQSAHDAPDAGLRWPVFAPG